MTVTEQRALPRFGEIELEDMRGNEMLTKTVMPLVRDVCKYSKGRFTVAGVSKGLVSGAYRLWGVMRPPASLDAVSVTRSNGDEFQILMLGPDPSDMTPFLPHFMAAARESGCKRLTVFGSPRWRNHFGDGWRMLTVYEHEL